MHLIRQSLCYGTLKYGDPSSFVYHALDRSIFLALDIDLLAKRI